MFFLDFEKKTFDCARITTANADGSGTGWRDVVVISDDEVSTLRDMFSSKNLDEYRDHKFDDNAPSSSILCMRSGVDAFCFTPPFSSSVVRVRAYLEHLSTKYFSSPTPNREPYSEMSPAEAAREHEDLDDPDVVPVPPRDAGM